MEGPSTFSSDGAEVIARPVDLAEQAAKTGSLGRDDEDLALEEYYEVEYTVQEILRRNFKRVNKSSLLVITYSHSHQLTDSPSIS